jgi:hypothetical protein
MLFISSLAYPLSRKSFVNLGRAICKVVSTFDSVESLIAEDDRRRDLEDARTLGDQVHGEEEVPTTEFVSFLRSLPIL